MVEDTARFVWNDKKMYARLRSLRHQLHEITAGHYHTLVLARDSHTDAGRTIKEGPRSSTSGVLAANIRRAEEAVRVLEEYSKVFSAQAGPKFKKIRYALYSEEKNILRKL